MTVDKDKILELLNEVLEDYDSDEDCDKRLAVAVAISIIEKMED